MSNFNVGDWVTPNKETLDKNQIHSSDPVRKSIGKTFRVTKSEYGSISLNENIGVHGRDGWDEDYWMLDKNYIVSSILKDL